MAMALAAGVAGCAAPIGSGDPGTGYPYEVTLPAGHAGAASDRFPLILYLHGAGGLIPSDNPIPTHAATRPDFPFVVIAPRTEEGWAPARLESLLSEVIPRYRIDETRLYLIGISMGAEAAWNLAAARPGRVAAMVMISGYGDSSHACRLRQLPLRLIHNRDDSIVPARFSETLAEALRACGSEAVLTTFYDPRPERVWNHDAWNEALSDPDLYAWLLQHRSQTAGEARRISDDH